MSSRRSLLKSATALVAASMITSVPAYAEEPIPVVATFSILGDMVERIGGDNIEVTTLVGPGGDTHVYQPSPRDAAAVAAAEVMFINGLEFEGWLDRLAEAAPFEGEMVIATNGIEAIAFEDEHDDHHGEEDHDDHDHEEHAEKDDDHDHDHEEHAEGDDHGDHHGHDHGAFDPHAWQTVENALVYVDNITAGLAKADPDNASSYYANREAYVAELEALGAEIDAMMASIPEENRIVVTSHDAFGYLAKHFDMTFKAPQGQSTESEASAADVAAIITQIRDESISAVFVETITDNRLLEQIANETGAVIGGTLYSGALSREDGPASTYIDMLRYNAKTLSEALGGEG